MEVKEFTQAAQQLRHIFVEVACTYLHSQDDAEDAVQEGLVKLWAARERIQPPEKFRAYGIAAIRNVCLNLLKKQKISKIVSIEGQIVSATSTPQSQLEDKENQQWLEELFETLPFKYRQLLRMRNVEKLSYAEIAQVMGTSEAAVRVMICRSRANLISKLKNHDKSLSI